MGIEENFPLEQVAPLATAESKSKHNYRPIYSLHKWWARRLGSIFRTIGLSAFAEANEPADIWKRYYQKDGVGGKIILDPFMGGGTTIIELNRLGAKTIGCDINPVAWWVVKKEMEPAHIQKLKEDFKKVKDEVSEEISSYYKTDCTECGSLSDVMYYFWVKKVKCIGCGKEVKLFKDYIIAKKMGKNNPVVLCPKCGDIFEVSNITDETKCPECENVFDPKEGTVERGSYKCACGQKYSVLKIIQREDKIPTAELFAVEYYCRRCKTRRYKKADENDLGLVVKAKEEFERDKEKLLIPEQKVPDGLKTKELINFNYIHFYQMFNERQLLLLSKLLKAIISLEDENSRELLLAAFSNSLPYNNMFATYDGSKRHSRDLFSFHAYIPPSMPVEHNIWGAYKNTDAVIGRGSFVSFYKRIISAKEYCKKPFEKLITSGANKTIFIQNEEINGRLAGSYEELLGDKNCLLFCNTSETLDLPDTSVDAVITDPPYFDNVMYSELSDFFYIWLRIALKDTYPEFKPEVVPRVNEIIKNDQQGKSEDFFIKGLTSVFTECNRVLKDDGIMVFTYHHRESKSWGSVLESVLKSGFYVSAIYPIHSEMSVSMHIRDMRSIEYDAIIICRKRTEEKRTTFENYEEELYINAKKIIENERKKRPHLSKGDISVIVFGKCLEIYSKYYPNITSDGEPVPVDTATDKVWEIIEQLSETDYLPPELDPITRAFTLNLFEPGGISYNELNKRLRQRGVDISELDAERLIAGPKNAKRPADPFSRKTYIEGKLGKDGEMLDIDKVQYLFILYTTDKNPSEWLRKWRTPELEQLCKILAEKTGDSRYANVMELTLDMF